MMARQPHNLSLPRSTDPPMEKLSQPTGEHHRYDKHVTFDPCPEATDQEVAPWLAGFKRT